MTKNIDSSEVEKFADLAQRWWDPQGEFKPLHIINPLRSEYIASKIELENLNILDVGCGGGLLCEALNEYHCNVSGIDAAGPGIKIAKNHAEKNKKKISYFEITAEENAGSTKTGTFFITNSGQTQLVNSNSAVTHKASGTSAGIGNSKS